MANLPEKNITTVDKITSIPGNTNLYINANGEFRQATVDDVLKASPVIADSITNQYKNASGSPILLTDSAKGVAIDFNAKGRSTQDGEPTPTEPITPKSNGDMGYFDGELLQGFYDGTTGVYKTASNWVCSANPIPCTSGDIVNVEYSEVVTSMTVAYYDENMTYISYRGLTNVSSVSVKIPSNAKYFYININTSAITPQTAKHICVTINDKYALIVDSVGKNELKLESSTYINGGITFTIDKGVLTVNGTPTAVAQMTTPITLKKGKYILSGAPSNSSAQTYRHYVYDSSNAKSYIDYGSNVEFEVYENSNLLYCVQVAVEVSNVTFYPMIRPLGTDATYEPYKKSRKYIPISAPLRSSLDGSVTDVARLVEGKVDRELNEVTFDGSSDEVITLISSANTNTTLFGITMPIKAYPLYTNCICSHFVYSTDSEDNEHCRLTGEATPVFAIWISKSRASTIDELRSWLSSNPIKVVYRRAEPTTESIEPIDVDTFEGVTQISVSDNADMEVEYPTSKVAGIASIGWSKGRRAEYDLEQLKVQMLALQTTIVSTV